MHPSKRTLRLALFAGFVSLVPPALAQEAGFGKDIPIGAAARQIVPESFKVEIGDGVDSSSKASWNGGGWRQSLAAAARSAGYAAIISGETVRIVKVSKPVPVASEEAAEPAKKVARPVRKERTVERRPRTEVIERESATVETVSSAGFVLVPAKSEAPAKAADWKKYEAKKVAVAEAVFVVREGQSLRSVLDDWSRRAGWKLVWGTDYEYQLTSSAKFTGDFSHAAHELLRSMSEVRPQVTATFYAGNKTLVVGNELADAAGY